MANSLTIGIQQISQDIVNNRSLIRVTVTATFTYWAQSQVTSTAYISINGSSYSAFTAPVYNVGNGGSVVIGTFDRYITHNSDGTKSVAASAYWYPPYVSPTGAKFSGSGSKTLTTIPRTSDITSFPNFDVDGTFSIGVNKKSSSFHDDLRIYYGSTVVRTMLSYTSGKTIAFNADEKNIIYGLMSTVNSGSFRAEIITYNGSTKIGTTSKNATGTIYNANPLFSGFTWKSTNLLNLADNQTIIKGYSNLAVTVKAATAQKGASIQSYKVQCGTQVYTTASISEISAAIALPAVDDSVIKAYAIDSRGNATEMIQNVTKYIDYKPLILSDVAYDRGDGGIGTEVTINYKGTAWVGSFGISSNALTGQYFYKESGSSTWIQGTTTINPSTTGSFFFSGAIRGDLDALGFDAGKNFDLKIRVADKLSVSDKELIISKGVPQVAYGNGGVSFGSFYNESAGGALQVKGINIVDLFYPIGFEITTSKANYNPNNYFPGTTWVRIKGRVIVGVDEADTEFATVNKTGGEKAHSLTVAESPPHSHGTSGGTLGSANYGFSREVTGLAAGGLWSDVGVGRGGLGTGSSGGGRAHNNLQPYITKYIWERTA